MKTAIVSASLKIRNSSFHSTDALTSLDFVEKGDVVYLDPPYFASTSRYIGEYHLEKLEDLLNKLNLIGAKWLLSYDAKGVVEISSELYKNSTEALPYKSRLKRITKMRTLIHVRCSTVISS